VRREQREEERVTQSNFRSTSNERSIGKRAKTKGPSKCRFESSTGPSLSTIDHRPMDRWMMCLRKRDERDGLFAFMVGPVQVDCVDMSSQTFI
jgi:hypothetical protein